MPKGVIAAISPWNAPGILGVRAVARGNTVVMKPSEDAPIACGLLISDVLHEAGLPAGVLNAVTNDRADAAEVVSALIADDRVRMVNYGGQAGAEAFADTRWITAQTSGHAHYPIWPPPDEPKSGLTGPATDFGPFDTHMSKGPEVFPEVFTAVRATRAQARRRDRLNRRTSGASTRV
ncbi:Aldehyde dehydrogenase family protein [Streptomyces mirabilis]|uniref:Aldehyde dehydrogenase family protein n=1 Tax=Streptomyces mirabilis TaxID=68239 RepID=A0A1I2NAF9_9ACTN|nr:Aldehyde dehydrogenase family protein [Streptomyces mirabilis]